ncbi:MAG: hypothetical protein WAT23_17040 [Chromatiaceae bacterium]
MFLFKFPAKFGLLFLAALAAGVLWQQEQLTALALVHINPLPETRSLMAEQRYAEAGDYLDFFMTYDYVNQDSEALALQAEIQEVRQGVGYQTQKIADGLWTGTSDEVVGQAAGVISDFFVIGDLRDLAQQGTHWFQDEAVDEVMTALATIGVVASAAQVASTVATVGSGGAAAPSVVATTAAKGGVVILKAARKVGKLPAWLIKAILEGTDTVGKTKKLDGVSELLGDVYSLAKVRGGIALLDKTADVASLKRLAKVADTFGDQTATLYRLGGQAFLDTARQAGTLGVATIKTAATYGPAGLRLLDKIGALKFVKFTTRGSKILYKGDILTLLARMLAALPLWVLYLIVGCGALVWVPWQQLRRLYPIVRATPHES